MEADKGGVMLDPRLMPKKAGAPVYYADFQFRGHRKDIVNSAHAVIAFINPMCRLNRQERRDWMRATRKKGK